MDPKLKKRWTRVLRSGRYETHAALYNSLCVENTVSTWWSALGVLVDIAYDGDFVGHFMIGQHFQATEEQLAESLADGWVPTILWNIEALPDFVESVGLNTERLVTLENMSLRGESFKRIADWVETTRSI